MYKKQITNLNSLTMVRFSTLILIAITALMTSCSTSTTEEDQLYKAVSTATAKEAAVSDIEQDVMDAVNGYRVSIGLNALEFNAVAHRYANEHNGYMIAAGEISHDNFALRSSKLSSEVNADHVSENLGIEFTNAGDILEAWKNSPTHKKVMEGDFSFTAVSVTPDADGVLYFTQLFFK